MPNYTKLLAELNAERANLSDAITTLERLALGGGKRRGRPPAWMKAATAGASGRTRKAFSKETRARMAASQRKRWAARHKASVA